MKHPNQNTELEALVLSVESDPRLKLQVPSKLSKPHPMVSELNFDRKYFDRFNSRDEKVTNQGNTFDSVVGKSNRNRAKLILDTFIKAIEQRGHKILNKDGNTLILIFGEELKIRLWEKSRFIDKKLNSGVSRDMELSGELYIQYITHGCHVERQWGDSVDIKLEDKLARVIGSLEYIGKKERDQRIKREQYWQEQKIKESIRKELNDKKQTEFNNFKLLLSQSVRWERSQSLRAFISHIEENTYLTIEGIENRQDWIKWAMAKADWYDPTVVKNDDQLNAFSEFHESLLEGKKQIDPSNIDKL